MEVEAVNDTVLCGYKRSAYWAWQQDLYFYAVFSKPFTHTLYTDTIEEGGQQIPVCKMLLRFDTAEDEQVMVRFSISSVDGEGARQNLLAELPDWDFDKVRADARKTWNDCLSKIEVKTEDPRPTCHFLYCHVSCILESELVYRCRRALFGDGFKSAHHR